MSDEKHHAHVPKPHPPKKFNEFGMTTGDDSDVGDIVASDAESNDENEETK